jgi:hypothetical protein
MKDNFVAKNAHKYNTAKVFDNRKAKAKNGYRKHKGSLPDESYRGRNVTHSDIAGVGKLVTPADCKSAAKALLVQVRPPAPN